MYDNMENKANIEGDNNIVIQGVQDSSITLNIRGNEEIIDKKLDQLIEIVRKLADEKALVQFGNKSVPLRELSKANFNYHLGRLNFDNQLPLDLREDLVTDKSKWLLSLKQDLVLAGINVGNRPSEIIKHYGWVIEAHLQKMQTPIGKQDSLRRLSFMVEAYHSSVRYLCFIQLAQLAALDLKIDTVPTYRFFTLSEKEQSQFDYTELLINITNSLSVSKKELFIPEITNFVHELTDTYQDLYTTSLFLEHHRSQFLAGLITDDEDLHRLLDEFLTALAFWLRKLSFIGRYRLISVKDIQVDYRLKTEKSFIHLYGELHGMYNEMDVSDVDEDYQTVSMKDKFTYNRSILLLKGHIQGSVFSEYLSLTPFLIDNSVFTEKPTQTPEVYYYHSISSERRQYNYALYKNELGENISSNKLLRIKVQNNGQPKLNVLFKHIEDIKNILNKGVEV